MMEGRKIILLLVNVFAFVLTNFAALATPQIPANAQTTTQSPVSIKPVTPAGVFSNNQQPLPSLPAQSTQFDFDFDDYVPYRSDVHDYFSWDLLKQVLRSEHTQNVIISPFSVKILLALLSEAAGNNTQSQKELMSTLTDIKAPDNLRGFYKKTLASLKNDNPFYTLNLETRLYTDDFIEPQQRYAAILHDYYQTDIVRLKFADSANAANAINAWSTNVTHGRLQQLISEEKVQNNVMLMANVIYFNGLWRREFNETYPGVFFKEPHHQLKTDYMQIIDYFYYYNSPELNAKILRLPYKGKKFSMFVLLPTAKGDLDDLTGRLENDQLKRMQWMMEETKLKVVMPKFKFEYNKNLKETLQHLGINNIFTADASLPGLARGADVAAKLRVSNVIQKAGIDVNEKGTEVFASTVVEIENKFGGNSFVEFIVNRPFIFFIEEEASGNILFAGKVIEPSA